MVTHPIMRRFDSADCDSNKFVEMAKVAAVSCMHQCMKESCRDDPKTGEGCCFDFPKKNLNHTVTAVMQVNTNQMEARILLRKTCGRVPNLNRFLLRYLRSNHDVTVMILCSPVPLCYEIFMQGMEIHRRSTCLPGDHCKDK
jgi:hypothetical protein